MHIDINIESQNKTKYRFEILFSYKLLFLFFAFKIAGNTETVITNAMKLNHPLKNTAAE